MEKDEAAARSSLQRIIDMDANGFRFEFDFGFGFDLEGWIWAYVRAG